MSEKQEIKFVTLTGFATSMEAGMVKELLENNGISVLMQGANFGGLEPLPMPGGFSEVTLQVPEGELEHARQLYDAFFEERGSALRADKEVPEELQ